MAVSYPFIVQSLHVSYGTLGIVLGIAGVVGGVLQGVAGFFEKVSARLLLTAQNLGLAVSVALAGAAPGFALFGAARCLGSIVSWPQHPIGNSVLLRRFPTRRAFALSWHTAGGSIGTAVIPLIATGLIAAFGWRWELVLIATPMALGGFLVMARLREAMPDDHFARAGANEGAATVLRLRDVITRREVIGALAAGTVAAAGRGLGALNTYAPAYLRSGLHLSTITVGAVFTVVVVGSIGGPIMVGMVADRLGRSRVLASVYLVGA
ncbi:MAG: MFS transporter, partial [Acidimicrobiales bacterium]